MDSEPCGFGNALELLGDVARAVWDGIKATTSSFVDSFRALRSDMEAIWLRLMRFLAGKWADFLAPTFNRISTDRREPHALRPRHPGRVGHLPFSATGGALLFHLLSKLYERTSVAITDLSFSEWATVFGDAKITTVLIDRLTHRCQILESKP